MTLVSSLLACVLVMYRSSRLYCKVMDQLVSSWYFSLSLIGQVAFMMHTTIYSIYYVTCYFFPREPKLGSMMFGNFLLTTMNSFMVMDPAPELAACLMTVSAFLCTLRMPIM